MTYATYYIHPQSLSVNIRDFYKKYETALKRLKPDVEEFIKTNKNITTVEYINKKIDLSNKPIGYYLKLSNKYPNRITIYEKLSKINAGYIYNSSTTEVKKVFVFGLLELSSMPDEFNIDSTFEEAKKSVIPKIGMLYLEELKEKISSRYIETD